MSNVEVKDVVCDYGVFSNGELVSPIFNIKSNAEMVRKIIEADEKKVRLDDCIPDTVKRGPYETRQAMVESLSKIKGFDTGTTTRVSNKFILDYYGNRFVVTLRPINNPNPDMFKDIKEYLK